jgi:hypothetical protein
MSKDHFQYLLLIVESVRNNSKPKNLVNETKKSLIINFFQISRILNLLIPMIDQILTDRYDRSMENNGVVIAGHQGLGDHMICIGLYREQAKLFKKCVLPINSRHFKAIKNMLNDVTNIQVVKQGSPSRALQIETQAKFLNILGYKLVLLGKYLPNYFDNTGIRFDEKFYKQANVDFDFRWKSFKFSRDLNKEDELYNKLVGSEKKYIFVHDDEERGLKINFNLLPRDFAIIRPKPSLSRQFDISNYTKIIERAQEIHCIESSFAAFIEGQNLDITKFAHRYAREETKISMHYEFTYRSEWNIIDY